MSNVLQKLSEARVLLQNKDIKKSGKNNYSNFNYFQLDDFLPHINQIFHDLGLSSHFYISSNELGIMTAVLNIYNSEEPNEVITFQSPVEDTGIKGASPIQALGGQHTYMRRYLWLEAMEITEADTVDSLGPDKKEEKKLPSQTPCTMEQIRKIQELYSVEEIQQWLQKAKVSDLSKLKQSQAQKIILARTGLNDQTPTF